jgi:dienelactone hydrolase
MKLTKTAAFFCIAAVVGCSGKTSTPGAGGNGSGDMSSSSGSGSSGGVSSNGGSGSGGSSGSTSGGSGSNGGGGSGSGGTSSSSGSGDDGGTGVTIGADGGIVAPPEVMGCGTTKLYKTSDDLSAAGPWPVGVKTAMLTLSGVSMPVEIWYPATLGSDSGKAQQTYDLRSWLPKGQASLIPDSANKLAVCNCYRDLPLDTTHGPYPAVIFVHGTGSFRVASMSTMTAWASRGFIAVAADHPGLFLTDFLASGNCQGDGTGTTQGAGSLNEADIDNEVTALTNKSGDFAFLGSSVDMSRIGIGGHSQGAAGAASAASRPGVPNVQVDMPLADLGGSVPSGSSLKSALFMGGANDSVVPYSNDTGAYSSTTAKIKRVISIAMGDHLDVTDLCYQTNSQGKTGIQVADQYNVCGTGAPSAALTLLNGLAKCGTVMPPIAGPEIVNYATTAALEETLHCINRDAAFSALKTKYSQVSDFEHTP